MNCVFFFQHMMRSAQNSAGEDCFSSDYEEELAQVRNTIITHSKHSWGTKMLIIHESLWISKANVPKESRSRQASNNVFIFNNCGKDLL